MTVSSSSVPDDEGALLGRAELLLRMDRLDDAIEAISRGSQALAR